MRKSRRVLFLKLSAKTLFYFPGNAETGHLSSEMKGSF